MKRISNTTKLALRAIAIALFTLAPGRGDTQTSGKTVELVSGVFISIPGNWSVTEPRNRNAIELVTPETSARGVPQARVFIGTEERRDHPEAVKRLAEIAAEFDAPTSFLVIGSWPALQRRYKAPLARRGRGEALARKELALHATTAIAAGPILVRVEGFVIPNADAGLADKIEAIGQSITFASRGDAATVTKEIETLRANPRLRRQPVTRPERDGRVLPGTRRLQRDARVAWPAVKVDSGRELEIAVGNNGDSVVIAYNPDRYSVSSDAGRTFKLGPKPAPFTLWGDPSLAVGKSGAFYYAALGYPDGEAVALNFDGCSTAISMSTNNGHKFLFQNHAVRCPLHGPPYCFPDQPKIAADRSQATANEDQVYSVWRHFQAAAPVSSCRAIDVGGVSAQIACSTDSGKTWTPPKDIYFPGSDFPRITVAGNGFVYVVFSVGSSIYVNKFSSCSNGLVPQANFPVEAATFTGVVCPVPGLDRCDDDNLASPTLAVDDLNPNHIYLAYADSSGVGNEDIVVRDSIDGGASWPRMVIANAAVSARRFMPWACSLDGELYISWYDRRAATQQNNDLTDYYMGNVFAGAQGLFRVLELNLTNNPDPECASGFPCGARSISDWQSCSVRPPTPGSGDGCPKYGDYNGNACGYGSIFNAWASATSPGGLPPGSGVRIFASTVAIAGPLCKSFPEACVGHRFKPKPIPPGDPFRFEVDPYIRASSIIFEGVVQSIQPEVNRLIVLAERVIAPQWQRGNASHEVSLQFTYARALRIGERWVFFAEGGLVGQGNPHVVAVMDVVQSEELVDEINRVSTELSETQLKQRVQDAQLIIAGTVTRVTPLGPRAAPSSEKPVFGWQLATVEIKTVFKGRRASEEVQIAFPDGESPKSVGARMYYIGDRGIWLLKQDKDLGAYIAASGDDYIAGDRLELVTLIADESARLQ